MSNHFLCSSPLSIAISNSLCFLWVCLFWTFHTSAFCDWLLSFSIVFKVCLFGNIYQYFICFYCWVIFHCMDIPHFVYSFISQWIHYSYLGCFHFSRECPGGSEVKIHLPMQEIWVWSPGWEDPLEKETATRCSCLENPRQRSLGGYSLGVSKE